MFGFKMAETHQSNPYEGLCLNWSWLGLGFLDSSNCISYEMIMVVYTQIRI